MNVADNLVRVIAAGTVLQSRQQRWRINQTLVDLTAEYLGISEADDWFADVIAARVADIDLPSVPKREAEEIANYWFGPKGILFANFMVAAT
jgi:hypothetical protein